ncbi:hypothetical protein DFJ74DRAFT_659921 [Hyaloraphidium curvatum]|nr:hypothetical protein DFJ74DRAFT_659921 [Hyaloraphidium curvatum]
MSVDGPFFPSSTAPLLRPAARISRWAPKSSSLVDLCRPPLQTLTLGPLLDRPFRRSHRPLLHPARSGSAGGGLFKQGERVEVVTKHVELSIPIRDHELQVRIGVERTVRPGFRNGLHKGRSGTVLDLNMSLHPGFGTGLHVGCIARVHLQVQLLLAPGLRRPNPRHVGRLLQQHETLVLLELLGQLPVQLPERLPGPFLVQDGRELELHRFGKRKVMAGLEGLVRDGHAGFRGGLHSGLVGKLAHRKAQLFHEGFELRARMREGAGLVGVGDRGRILGEVLGLRNLLDAPAVHPDCSIVHRGDGAVEVGSASADESLGALLLDRSLDGRSADGGR